MWSRMAKMPTFTADLGICLFCPDAATVFYYHPLPTTFVHMIGCFPHMSRGNTRPCKNSFENQAKANGMIYATTRCGFYSRLQQFLVVGFWHPWDWNFPIVAHHFGGELLLGSGLQFVPACIRQRVRDLQVEVKPPCVPPNSLQTRHSDGSSGEPGSRWLLERSRTFLTS